MSAQQPASNLPAGFPSTVVPLQFDTICRPILQRVKTATTPAIQPTAGSQVLRSSGTTTLVPTAGPGGNTMNMPIQWLEETVIGRTTFDVQTNGSVSDRIVKNADGTISAAWNFSKQTSPFNDRGTGYNYYDPNSAGLWTNGWLNPIGNTGPGLNSSITRTEGSYRTGYTNIIVTASGNEMSVAHSSTSGAMLLNRRAVKGTGTWTQLPAALNNSGGTNFDTWAKGVADGDTIHLIWNGSGTSGTNVNGQNGPIFYSRSNDGGLTWPILRTVIPAINSTSYRGWDADAYAIDAKNGVVVIVYGDFDTDVGIIKSTDGGTTWTKKIVQQFPIPLFDANTMSTDAYGPNGTGAPDGIADTLLSNGADAHALIDNSGMVHVWFSKMRVYSRTAGLGLSYFPNSDGLYYWNETKPVNGYVLVAQTLDMNNNGVVNLPSGGACSSPYGYYDGGLTQMPSAGIDASGNLYVTYQSICELCDTTTATLAGYQARRHIYMITSSDNGVTWTTPKDIVANISYGGNGEREEAVYASMARTVDSKAYVLYQRDDQPGTSILISGDCDQYNNNGQSDIVLAKVDAAFARNTSVRAVINVNAPINCYGGTTTVSVIGAGGTPPYTGTGTYTRAAGTYTFTVVDAIGISSTASVTITQPTQLTATSSATTPLCNGDSVQVTISASGGTPPYSGTGVFTRLAGNYSYTVLDSVGCSVVVTGNIPQPTAIVATATPGTIACHGGTTTVTVSATGGTSPYSGTGIFTAAAGNYSYLITDAKGCIKSVTGTINQPATLTASSTAGTIACNGGTASIIVSGSGGTPPYTGTGTFSRPAGSYTFSILDANGCTATTSGSLTQPTAVSPVVNTTPSTTLGGTNGTASVIVTGGTSPYTYLWSNGATTATASGLATGNYTVTVTDSRGCTATSSGFVGDPNCNLQVNVSSSTINCFGGTSSVSVTASGGTPPYQGTGSYTRSAGPYSFTVTDSVGCSASRSGVISQPSVLSVNTTVGTILCNGQTTTVNVTASGGTPPYTGTGTFTRSAGPFSYVISDANNCTASINGNISQPAILNATATGSAIACFGDSTSINVSASGGTAPYSGTGVFNVPAGTYSYTITDFNGCTDTAGITLTQPAAALVASSTTGTIACNGGTATVTVSATGGTQPYTGTGSFTIASGNYNYTVTDDNGCVSITSGTLNQPDLLTVYASAGSIACFGGTTTLLVSGGGGTAPYTGTGSFTRSAGAYSYTITDANGCTANASGTITQPTLLSATSATTAGIACFGGSTTVNVSASGGTLPYSGIGSFTATAGPYTYTVTDGRGCTATTSGTISQPASAVDATATAGTIACNGGTTNITVAATGGTAPYTGTGTFSVSAGPYSYTVSDANGCRDTVSGTITQPTALVATATAGTIACNGGSASVTVTASGGTAPYTGTGTFTRTAGSYTFTVTDARGCVKTASVTITQPAVLVASSSAGTITCNGGTTTVTVAASGGTTPYTGTGTFTRSAGAYSYTVTDARNCSSTTTGTITQPTAIVITVNAGTIQCNGGTTSVTVTATGGTPAYSGTGTFTRPAGAYSFTVTDANGCSSTATGSISQPSPLLAASSTGTIACFGGSTNVVVTASGGVTPYTGTGTFTRSVGNYSFTVTDANNCQATTTGTISQPSQLVAASTAGTIRCFGGSATITVTATGGTSPYTGTGSFSRNAGAYSFTVTDANGCTATTGGTLTQPTALSATVSTTNATTVGGNNGAATASVSGGTSPYTYSWSNGATTATASGLRAGSYTVTITDANGCTTTATGSVGDPSCNIIITVTGTSINCFGGTTTVTVSATGGTAPYTGTGSFIRSAGPYTYTVTDAIGCSAISSGTVTQPTVLTASSTAGQIVCNGGTTTVTVTASGGTPPYTGTGSFTRSAGTYSYTVTDSKGCTNTTVGSISQPTAVTVSSTFPPIACYGQSTSITITASGGNAPYTGTGTFVRTAGPYTYTVTDASGCSASITGNISQPAALSVIGTSGTIFCNGGSTTLSITASGGTQPYTGTGNFTRTAGPYTYTVTDANGCSASTTGNITQPAPLVANSSPGSIACFGGSTTVTVSATGGTTPYIGTGTFTRTAGSYSYTVTDANGCTAVTSGTITQPTLLTASSIAGTVSCNGGSTTVVVSANGGSTPYTGTGNFTRGAGNYTFTVTDARGCTASSSVSITQPTALIASSSFNNISCNGGSTTVTVAATGGTTPYNGTGNFTRAAGSYSFTVVDANGCSAVTSGSISQPAQLVAAASAGNIACYGGSTTLTVSATGGTSPYTGTGSFTRSAGAYSYTITDANGCTASTSGAIAQPLALSASVTTTGASTVGGNNGTATASVSGGTAPFSYRWSNNASTASINGLTAGTYTVTITDANGCTTSASGSVGDPSCNLLITVTGASVSCFGGTTSVVVSASGGTAPYTGTGTFTRSAGPFSFTVSDAIGCSATASGTITQPTALSASSSFGNIACNGGATSVVVSASGGNSPYSGTGTFSRQAGSYSFTITDANGCTASTSGNIPQPAALTASSSTGTIACNGASTSVVVTASGGTAPYSGTGTFSRAAGNYSYTVTDANGCSATASGTINQPPVLAASASVGTIPCTGGTTSITIAAAGGTAPYTGTGTFVRSAGAYSYTISDANGCTASTSGNISQPSVLNVSATAGIIACNGGSTSVVVTASGGTAPYIGAGTFSRPAGAYSYTVTDANGCTASVSGNISQPNVLTATATAGNILCNAGSTSVTLTASGGTTPYAGTGTFVRTAGPYSYTVTDANGCTASASGNISQPASLSASSSYGTILCSGATTTVTVTATGGTLPYAGVGSFTRGVGAYSYTVTDANGCTAATSGSITQPAALNVTANAAAILCFGGAANVTVAASGGTPPYSGTGSFSRTAGAYSFTVTDANGCTAAASVNIAQPTALSASVSTTAATTVGGSNGSATVNVSGGSPAYTYRWSNNATTATASALTAGTYTVTVTDANGCSTTASGSVGDPSCNITISVTGTSVTCFGGSTSVVVAASGGTAPYAGTGTFSRTAGPYSFTVTDAIGCSALASGSVSQPTELIAAASAAPILCNGASTTLTLTASGGTPPYSGTGNYTRAAGPYSITVSDANGCRDTVNGNLQQPAPISVSTSSGNIACFGGTTTITVAASGGTPPYSGTGTFSRTAGAYAYTVTDVNNCSASAAGNITQPAALSVTATAGRISCNGGSTSVVVAATGGTAPYTGTGTFTRTAGSYTYTVNDANGCTANTSITINQPTVLSATSSSGTIACSGGSTTVTVSATGGTTPYTGTGTFTRTAGSYSYTVTDANGCTAVTSGTITQPSALSATATAGSIACNGGTANVTVTATGGTAPYSGTGIYSRSAGTYAFTVSDSRGCTASAAITLSQPTALIASSSVGSIACNGGTTSVTVSALGGTSPYSGVGSFTRAAGSYSFTVVDANGCSASISGSISQPAQLVAAASAGNIAC
ncbi:MAG: hypothetical protein ACKO1U_10575, partial [Bacteroidota bacterium]